MKFSALLNRLIISGSLVFLSSVSANAALTTETTTLISRGQGDNSVTISVQDGSAAATGTQTSVAFGDGTALDYAFYDVVANNLVTLESGSASNIGAASFDFNSGNGVNIATVNTNNNTFTSVGATSANDDLAADTVASIDISGLDSGSIYLVYGTFLDANQVTATASGAGVADVTINGPLVQGGLGAGTIGNNTGIWVTEFAFVNDGTFDSISFNYINADTTDGTAEASRARFFGVVLDGTVAVAVPEPGSLGLLVIMGAGIVGRRRR